MQNQNSDVFFNLEEGLYRIMNNKKLLATMLQMFMNSKELTELGEALTAKDYTRTKDLSHAVKGASGNLALTKLYQFSTDLNDQLKSGPLSDQAMENAAKEYFLILDKTRETVNQHLPQLKASQ